MGRKKVLKQILRLGLRRRGAGRAGGAGEDLPTTLVSTQIERTPISAPSI
jgi:hypothetical protein